MLTPEEARRLVGAGSFILLLDIPAGTDLGVDYKTFTTAERFKGMKMVPPGLHFVFYSSSEFSPRMGMFCVLQRLLHPDFILCFLHQILQGAALPGLQPLHCAGCVRAIHFHGNAPELTACLLDGAGHTANHVMGGVALARSKAGQQLLLPA